MVSWSECMWLFIKFDLTVICTVFVLRCFGISIPIISVFRFLTNKPFTQGVSLAEAGRFALYPILWGEQHEGILRRLGGPQSAALERRT